jgi:hypothetical protein
MNNVSGVNDDVGDGIESVDVGDHEFEIAHSLSGIGRIQGYMGKFAR